MEISEELRYVENYNGAKEYLTPNKSVNQFSVAIQLGQFGK